MAIAFFIIFALPNENQYAQLPNKAIPGSPSDNIGGVWFDVHTLIIRQKLSGFFMPKKKKQNIEEVTGENIPLPEELDNLDNLIQQSIEPDLKKLDDAIETMLKD